MNLLRAYRNWRMERDLDRRLALRKKDRIWRSQAAQKGWQTRRSSQ